MAAIAITQSCMCKRRSDAMTLLIWLFWTHTGVHCALFLFFPLPLLTILPVLPLCLPLSPPPPSLLPVPSSLSLHLSPFLPPISSRFFLLYFLSLLPPHLLLSPYSTAVGGEVQLVETIVKWLTPRQDRDLLTPNALMNTLRPLLRLSKLL